MNDNPETCLHLVPAAGEPRPVYASSPIKRRRRTKSDLSELRKIIYQILAADPPMTVRQVFYQLVSQALIAKTEAEYKATVVRLLTLMRRCGEIPFDWIADNTRWVRKPRTFACLNEAAAHMAGTYRRSVWDNQDAYVEVWLEKDALAGVLYSVTEQWDVPLMVTRGYPSVSYLHEAARAIIAAGKPAYLYYFGDYDPSGLDITRAVEEGVREFGGDAEIYFERVAVTAKQIEEWSLPTRPTKASDSRSKQFAGESVEVDAIPPQQLRQLAHTCIARHVDEVALAEQRELEQAERQQIRRWLKRRVG